MNISHIDSAVRDQLIPIIESSIVARPVESLPRILQRMTEALSSSLPAHLDCIRWHITPFQSITMFTQSSTFITLEEDFEFAAAHRLHCETLSPDENRRYFGKCNNPSGHGHNYRLRTSVVAAIQPDGSTQPVMTQVRHIVQENIINRFDHRHLNLDTAEFASLNPSVENIARVCHQLLDQPIAGAGGRLSSVTIWETEKTRCTYPAHCHT
jgi:6-pyruvoyltetrahydropterin/6-carboxytetrahydropterin synthase